MRFIAILLFFAGMLGAQPPTNVIQTETREVLVDAIVTDEEWRVRPRSDGQGFSHHARRQGANHQGFRAGIGIRQRADALPGPVFRRDQHGGAGSDCGPTGRLQFYRRGSGAEPPDGHRDVQRFRAHRAKLHRQCRPSEGRVESTRLPRVWRRAPQIPTGRTTRAGWRKTGWPDAPTATCWPTHLERAV